MKEQILLILCTSFPINISCRQLFKEKDLMHDKFFFMLIILAETDHEEIKMKHFGMFF